MLVAASAYTKGIYRDCMKFPWLIPSSRQINAHFHATMCGWPAYSMANIWWAYQKKLMASDIVSIPSQSPNGRYISKHLVYLIWYGNVSKFLSEAPGCHSTVQVQTWCWLEKSRWLVPIEHSWPPKTTQKSKCIKVHFTIQQLFLFSTANSPRPTGFCWLSLLKESLIRKGWSLQKCLPKVANHKA